MSNVLGNTLFAELVLALGLALIAGNGVALWKQRTGGEAAGELREGRARFLMAVGAIMAVWGGASLL